MRQFTGMLRLMRPANIVTAVSDVMAGFAIAMYTTHTEWNGLSLSSALLLILSTIGLYGGGVVMNDVFDAELDKVERPERPIPSGLVNKKTAALLGVILLLIGILAAALAHPDNLLSSSAIIAFAIAIAAVVYDKWGKHLSFFGPLNMGLCRGLNLLLGISIIPAAIAQQWFIAIVPILYIAAITMISRGEVHGGSKSILMGAVALYIIVIGCIFYISIHNGTLSYVVLFLTAFSLAIFIPLQKAIQNPKGPLIGKAVKAGVIALIIMNAAWAAAFGSLYFAIIILLLLPISILLGKLFMVT
jgi:4-hydroxybenzoate polyprenyltransferase